MNYQKNYDDYIQYVKTLGRKKSQRGRKNYVYYEGHHIVPRCFGGEGSSQDWKHPNIVPLTAREHFLAHYLLVKIYEQKLQNNKCERREYYQVLCALQNMTASNKYHIRYVNSRLWGSQREKFTTELSHFTTKRWSSPEELQKQSERIKQWWADNPELLKQRNETLAKKIREPNSPMMKAAVNNFKNMHKNKTREDYDAHNQRLRDYYSNDENRKAQSERMKQYYIDNPIPQEVQVKKSETMKQLKIESRKKEGRVVVFDFLNNKITFCSSIDEFANKYNVDLYAACQTLRRNKKELEIGFDWKYCRKDFTIPSHKLFATLEGSFDIKNTKEHLKLCFRKKL